MKSYLYSIAFLCIISSCSTTHYYVVRHAEKTGDPCNTPLLQPQGTNRADALKDSLLSKSIDSIFVSTCLRTEQTAQPLATALGISPIPFDITGPMTDSLIRRLKKIRGKRVLVVNHGGTVATIVLALSGETITSIPDSDYDNMYTIRIRRCIWTNRRLVHSTYGVITN